MNFKDLFLEKATTWVVGGELYNSVKASVAKYVENKEMSGEDKRALVINEAKSIFSDVAAVLINIAIEVAYLVISNGKK
jgi:hypothetical protein